MSWNLGDLFEGVAAAVPDRVAVVAGAVELSYAALDARAERAAHALAALGVGPGDRVAVALRNGHEYLEVLLAAFKLRAVPANLNTRYTGEELAALLADVEPTAVVHEPDLAGRFVGAGAGARLARGDAYEAALAAAPEGRVGVTGRSGDDRYLLYTGGTTGRPKGVLWRHEDLLFAALGGGTGWGERVERPEEVAEQARAGRTIALPASPLTHGTAQWAALGTLLSGGTVVLDVGERFDAVRLLDLAEERRVSLLVIVGDAFARPLADALEATPDRWSLDDLVVIHSGGAVLAPTTREELLRLVPWVALVDGYGTSETGGHGHMHAFAGQATAALPRFHVDEDTTVIDDAGRPAPPGSGLVGRLARRGHLPVGYHRDPTATAAVFTTIAGSRWAIPGDLARVEADGTVTLLGRGSSSINTGGEKVYPAEVEIVLKAHPAVLDAVVVGVPDVRFGERVAALVELRADARVAVDELEQLCRARLADFKVPRPVVVVDALERRPSGKPDLVAAKAQLVGADPPGPNAAG